MNLNELAKELIILTEDEKKELDDIISNYNKVKIIWCETPIISSEIYNIKVYDDFYSLYTDSMSKYQSQSYKENNPYESQKKWFNLYGVLQTTTTKAVFGYAYKVGTDGYKSYWTNVSAIVEIIKQTKEYNTILREEKLKRILK